MAIPALYYPYPLGGTPNGRYRSTATATPYSTAGAPGYFAGTGSATTSSTWITVTVTTVNGTSGTSTVYTSSPVTPVIGYPVGTIIADDDAAPLPRFEDAGVTAGEIIGYRAWLLRNDTLYSMYMDSYAWTPGGVEQAFSLNHSMHGIHSFKHAGSALAEYAPSARSALPIVFGEVAMWGEVYEHERGYRAEFAAIRKIYGIVRQPCGDPGEGRRRGLWPRTTDLEILRKRYGVVE